MNYYMSLTKNPQYYSQAYGPINQFVLNNNYPSSYSVTHEMMLAALFLLPISHSIDRAKTDLFLEPQKEVKRE